jgi:hypothetical protein
MTTHTGSCHCGTVTFEISGNLEKGVRCDCSLCKRKGAIMVLMEKDQFTLTSGEDNLSLYEWNSKVAKHYFCKSCGIYTHHKRRRDDGMGFNLGCVDDFNIEMLGKIGLVSGSKLSLIDEA